MGGDARRSSRRKVTVQLRIRGAHVRDWGSSLLQQCVHLFEIFCEGVIRSLRLRGRYPPLLVPDKPLQIKVRHASVHRKRVTDDRHQLRLRSYNFRPKCIPGVTHVEVCAYTSKKQTYDA